MTQIESLTLGITLSSVINHHSRDESVPDDCPGTRRPNAACADNPNARHDRRTIHTHRCSPVLIDRPGCVPEDWRQPGLKQPSPPRVETEKIGSVEAKRSQTSLR